MKRIIFIILFLCLFLITRATNVFVKLGTNYILKEKEWKGSINGVCAKLGYDTNQFYTYFPSDDGIKSDINYICFEIFTRDIVCVLCEDNVYELKEQDINNFLKDFDFPRIYSVYNRDTDLSEGIKRKNLNINFLAKALRIAYNKNSTDTVLISDIFKYKLYFKNSILCKFEYSDNYNSAAKEFMEKNPEYFKFMELYAKEYWGNNSSGILHELNQQCESLYEIPNGFRNEHLIEFPLDSDHNYYNFKMVRVIYYNEKITLREFKDICHGNISFIAKRKNNNQEIYIYQYRNAILGFYANGNLAFVEA